MKILTENTAKFAGGSALKVSLPELKNNSETPHDNRTNEEIKQDMVTKIKQFRKQDGLQ